MNKPVHAGLGDENRPKDAARMARPRGLYMTGADFIKMLFPVCYPDGSVNPAVTSNGGTILTGVTSIEVRGSWIQWTTCGNQATYFKLWKNRQPVSDWLPIFTFASETAIGVLAAQFRPFPAILYADFDRIEISVVGTTVVNAMIGAGGSEAQ